MPSVRDRPGDGGTRLRVLHVLAPAPWGGLETVVRMLASEQGRAGLDVLVAAVVGGEGSGHPFVERTAMTGVSVEPVVAPGRRYGAERSAIRALISEHRPHVVHTHGYRADVVDSTVARRSGVPTVSTVHGFTGNGLRNRFYEWLQRRALRSFDAVVAVAAAQVATLENAGVTPSSIHVVPNAWRMDAEPLSRRDARERLGLPQAASIVGFVGRLSPEKGGDVLVEALGRPELRHVQLCLVGRGSDEPELRRIAERRSVASRVHWAGEVESAGRLMAAFDVLALPSRTEGTPMVLFEAVAAGVPVVASAVGGVPDVLGDGPNLVPPDDPGALARALARLLTDDDDADEALGRARTRIDAEYGVDTWIRRHLDLYRGLGGEGGGPCP